MNKLTDAEIMKALECCGVGKYHCLGEMCPKFRDKATITVSECRELLMKDTIDLINRKTAEIDRLRYILVNFMGEIFDWGNKNGVDTRIFAQTAILGKEKDGAVKQIKSEAYKEFAERLKEKRYWDVDVDDYIFVADIDNLVKEMAGE